MVELEIKFQLDAEAVTRWRRALTAQDASTERLRAIYVDTDDSRLAQARVALRLRREGPRWVQTLKAEGASAIHRLEHEVTLPDRGHAPPALDITRHAGSDAHARLQAALIGAPPDALRTRFETDVRRLKLRVQTADGSDIEIALDIGAVRADGRSAPIAELELEHKGGPQSGLFLVASDVVEAGSLWLSTVSKAERGERLRLAQPDLATKAAPMPRLRHSDGAAWLRAALHNVLAHILPNASAVAAGSHDPEQIHQLRVGLRRLRTVVRELAALSDAIDPAWESSLRECFVRLGEQRDSEAVAGTVRRLLKAAQSPAVALPPAPAVETAAAVRMPALQLTLIHALALAHAPDAAVAPLTRNALKTLIAARLQRLHRQVLRDGRRFDELEGDRAHRVRKRLKRLRYLAELAQTLWPHKAVARFVAQLEPAQDALGAHNDIAVAARALDAQTGSDPASRAAAELLAAQQRKTRRHARAALRRLPRDKVFWTTR
jgi:inorganic triphosphatase YgiF